MKQIQKQVSYIAKKQLHGGFKIVEVSVVGSYMKRQTIRKNLTVDEAEEFLYRHRS